MKKYTTFLYRCFVEAVIGDKRYYAWMTFLTILALVGLNAYCKQFVHGLSVTGLTDHVSWGVYIANFTFLVGIAAAAVMLVIPGYIYKDKQLREVVIFGELLAIAAILMCLAFIMVDLGRPLEGWHLMPIIGEFNFPGSVLTWDVIVLNFYLVLNIAICWMILFSRYQGKKPNKLFYLPSVLVAMVWAISIHTVTAFLYVGLGGRPFWNSAIVAPRFLASAFVSGPAVIIIALQVLRKLGGVKIKDELFMKLRSIVQVSMIINVFLLLCEIFKEFYTESSHGVSAQYLFFGLHGYSALVPWIWTALTLNGIALLLFILPASKSLKFLDVACVLAIVGIWIEKGMGLIVPAFIPTPLGEIVEYTPSLNETLISVGIWAFGIAAFTVMLKVAVPILDGRVHIDPEKETTGGVIGAGEA